MKRIAIRVSQSFGGEKEEKKEEKQEETLSNASKSINSTTSATPLPEVRSIGPGCFVIGQDFCKKESAAEHVGKESSEA